MAKIDTIRRAEIGREKRARTRALLIAAAHSLFARQAVESVTVDDVVKGPASPREPSIFISTAWQH